MSQIERFMNLFSGYEKAHGQYRVTSQGDDGKLSGRAITNSEPAVEKNYEDHLSGGSYILGIIMLKENNHCSFGCIDIDIRGVVKLEEPLEELEKKIRHPPLVLCRSKS